ncbi:C39 family peptidase [Bacillus sp. FSL M8-0168]|uniref:C39 family peptidase n=1 Tax=Bacillus sp. FSL M8-0168 TaxID=2921614 RepID=UPI0030FDC2B6
MNKLKLLAKCYLEVIIAIVGILVFFALLFLVAFLNYGILYGYILYSALQLCFLYLFQSLHLLVFLTKLMRRRERKEIMKKSKFKWKQGIVGITLVICLGSGLLPGGNTYLGVPTVEAAIKVNKASGAFVTTAALNVRKGPSVKYKRLGTLRKNTTINVKGKTTNNWYRISYKGKSAYVSGRYLKKKGSSSAHKTKTLNVPIVLQNPQLPAGCEATSLTMALNYKGVKVSKIKIANEMPYTQGYDPNKGYVGSPYNYNGYTINPVSLQKTAKKYRHNSANLTGASLTTLEKEVKKGNPVLAWFTIGYKEVRNTYKYKNGKRYWWPKPLHCIVIVGSDKKKIYINDPLNGRKAYGIERTKFNRIYKNMGKRALVVR